jgi:hypothetical protein
VDMAWSSCQAALVGCLGSVLRVGEGRGMWGRMVWDGPFRVELACDLDTLPLVEGVPRHNHRYPFGR